MPVAFGPAARGAEIRNRNLLTSLRYRGREGMWTWILHRVTGLGVLFFLIIHVVETASVIYYPDLYDRFLATYKSPLFRFAELLIFFSVLFHAANGLRIIVFDFWPMLMRRQRQLTWAVALLTALIMLPVAWVMLAPLAGLRAEPGVERHHERCAAQPDAPACRAAAPTRSDPP